MRLSAGIAVGILCLPTVASLSEDALRAVPLSLREAAYGLGSTRFDVSLKVVVPAALSGIVSAFLLAVARAIGETMIVALAAGSLAQLTLDPRNQIQTMTGHMTQMAKGDLSNFDVEYYSIYSVALVLFFLTLTLTFIGNLVRQAIPGGLRLTKSRPSSTNFPRLRRKNVNASNRWFWLVCVATSSSSVAILAILLVFDSLSGSAGLFPKDRMR